MQCLGRKKDFKRCGNNASFLFCRHHKFQPYVLVFTISSVIGVYAGIFQDVIKPLNRNFNSHSQRNNTIQLESQQVFKDSIDTFNILILPFDRLENCQYKETNIEKTIKGRLLQLSEEQHLNLQVEFLTDEICPSTFEEGEVIGKNHKANMVVWGDMYEQCGLDSTQACLKYVVTHDIPHSVQKRGATEIATIRSMADIKQGYLQKDIELVIYTTLGLEAYTKLEFRRALAQLSKAYKKRILLFLERFRNAHTIANSKYLENIYSQEAKIIVGKVTVKDEGKHSTSEKSDIELIARSRSEYLNKLDEIVSNNDYVNLEYKDIKIFRHRRNQNVLGISIQAIWESKLYHDEGYLFLEVDFQNEFQPVIVARTWQPRPIKENDLLDVDEYEKL